MTSLSRDSYLCTQLSYNNYTHLYFPPVLSSAAPEACDSSQLQTLQRHLQQQHYLTILGIQRQPHRPAPDVHVGGVKPGHQADTARSLPRPAPEVLLRPNARHAETDTGLCGELFLVLLHFAVHARRLARPPEVQHHLPERHPATQLRVLDRAGGGGQAAELRLPGGA